jgi:hypothetical protein
MDSNKNLFVGDSAGPIQIFSTQQPSATSISIPMFTSTIAVSYDGQTVFGVTPTSNSFTGYSTGSLGPSLGNFYTNSGTQATSSVGLPNIYWMTIPPDFAPGNFLAGPKITTASDSLVSSIYYSAGSWVAQKWYINSSSNSLISSGSDYSGQVYSASVDTHSNFYLLMMPIGSSNVSNIEIKYARYAYNNDSNVLSTLADPTLYSKYTVGAIRKSIPVPYVPGGYWDGVTPDAGEQFFIADPAANVSNYYTTY